MGASGWQMEEASPGISALRRKGRFGDPWSRRGHQQLDFSDKATIFHLGPVSNFPYNHVSLVDTGCIYCMPSIMMQLEFCDGCRVTNLEYPHKRTGYAPPTGCTSAPCRRE